MWRGYEPRPVMLGAKIPSLPSMFPFFFLSRPIHVALEGPRVTGLVNVVKVQCIFFLSCQIESWGSFSPLCSSGEKRKAIFIFKWCGSHLIRGNSPPPKGCGSIPPKAAHCFAVRTHTHLVVSCYRLVPPFSAVVLSCSFPPYHFCFPAAEFFETGKSG